MSVIRREAGSTKIFFQQLIGERLIVLGGSLCREGEVRRYFSTLIGPDAVVTVVDRNGAPCDGVLNGFLYSSTKI